MLRECQHTFYFLSLANAHHKQNSKTPLIFFGFWLFWMKKLITKITDNNIVESNILICLYYIVLKQFNFYLNLFLSQILSKKKKK